MCLRMNLFVATLLMSLTLLLPAAARAEDPAEGEAAPEAPAETPLEMAQNDTLLLTQGEAGFAMDRYWDLDAVVKATFGAHLEQHTPEEIEELKQLLKDHIQRHNGSPRNLFVLRNSKFEGFRVRERSGTPKTALITYTLVIAKTERVLMSLIVREDGKSWRIIDGGAMGKMMVSQMRAEYRTKAKSSTPLEYTRAMLKALDARSNETAIIPKN
jgi:ABC-type transporter MlaC component